MYFLVDNDKQIIFGWNAKCGCSHIKRIYWFLKSSNFDNKTHTHEDYNELPDNIENYVTIIIARNPYKRLVSGFLEKYEYMSGEFRHLWKDKFLSFSQFVDKLISNDWNTINNDHFAPQTSQKFDKKILLSKTIKFYDISQIDYEYIEQLYAKKIPNHIIDKKEGHERCFRVKNNLYFDKYVYDLNIDDYIDYLIDIKYFYNEEIKEKVLNFFIDDFSLFKENGIDYILHI
tara:strand:+ start:537 stop:1229 length:693 start_codon:yes stop_codon:yes gene_type:complete